MVNHAELFLSLLNLEVSHDVATKGLVAGLAYNHPVLVTAQHSLPSWYWWYVIGYGFAVVGGHVAANVVVKKAWKALGWTGKKEDLVRPDAWQPEIVGIVERFLYVASLQFAHAEFIGFWLAIKSAGQWKRWNEETVLPGRTSISGRSVYQNFLIGNAFSILYSVVGFKLIEWASKQQRLLSWCVSLALVLITCAVWLLIPEKIIQEASEKLK